MPWKTLQVSLKVVNDRVPEGTRTSHLDPDPQGHLHPFLGSKMLDL